MDPGELDVVENKAGHSVCSGGVDMHSAVLDS